jgi:hypothetical protein
MTTSQSVPVPSEPMDDDETTPALFHHCVTVYNAMFKESKPVIPMRTQGSLDELEDEPGEADAILVYEGHLTRLFQQLHLSVPYYTSVTQKLKSMGCIAQLRRGGGNAPSQWQMICEPDEETFRAAIQVKRQTQGKDAMLEQQIRAVNLRVSTLEEIVQGLLSHTHQEGS